MAELALTIVFGAVADRRPEVRLSRYAQSRVSQGVLWDSRCQALTVQVDLDRFLDWHDEAHLVELTNLVALYGPRSLLALVDWVVGAAHHIFMRCSRRFPLVKTCELLLPQVLEMLELWSRTSRTLHCCFSSNLLPRSTLL